MKKTVWQVINESLAGTVDSTPVALIDDSRSVFQIVNESIAEVNYLMSESALSLAEMSEDLISAVLMNESAQAETLNEGIGKSIGDGIRKFFAMIKRFITNIIDKIKFMIDANRKNGAQLVATYGSRVKGVSTDGVEIKGYKYLTDKVKGWVTAGNVADISNIEKGVDDVDSVLAKLLANEKVPADANISDYNKALSNASAEFTKEHLDKLKEDNSDFQQKMVDIVKAATGESVNGKTITDIQQELMKIARDNQTEKVVVKAKDHNMDAIMKDLSAGVDLVAISRSLDSFKKNVTDTQNIFEKKIKVLESVTDNRSDSKVVAEGNYTKTNASSYLNAAKECLGKIYNINNAINAVVVKIVEEDYKQKVQLFIAVAKKTKPAKKSESADDFDELDLEEFEY